jgi:tape measure domain-containing protein
MAAEAILTLTIDEGKVYAEANKVVESIKRRFPVKLQPSFKGFITKFRDEKRAFIAKYKNDLEVNVAVNPSFLGFKKKFETQKDAWLSKHDLEINAKINPSFIGFKEKFEAESKAVLGGKYLEIPTGLDLTKAKKDLIVLKELAKKTNLEVSVSLKETSLAKIKAQTAAISVGSSVNVNNRSAAREILQTAGALKAAERASEGLATGLATVAASSTSNIAQNRILTGTLQKYLNVTSVAVPAAIGFADALITLGVAYKGLKDAAKLESITVGIDNIVGAQNEALAAAGKVGLSSKQFLKDLKQFAVITPFEFEDLAALSNRLLGVGFEAKETVKVMETLGNVVSVTGGDTTSLNGVIKAIGQIRGAGKLYAQDLNQIAQQLPGFNPYREIAKSIGQTEVQLRRLMATGKAPAGEQAIQVLLTSMQEFPGAADAMAKQSRTLVGTLSNLQDAIFNVASEEFGSSLGPARAFLNSIRVEVEEYLPDIASRLSETINLFADEELLGKVAARFAKHFNGFLDILNDFIEGGKTGFYGFLDGVLTFADEFFRIFGSISVPLADFVGAVGELSVPLSEAFGGVATATMQVWVNLLRAATPIVEAFAALLKALPSPIVSIGLGMLLMSKYTSQFASTLRLLQLPRLVAGFTRLSDVTVAGAKGFNSLRGSSDGFFRAAGTAGKTQLPVLATNFRNVARDSTIAGLGLKTAGAESKKMSDAMFAARTNVRGFNVVAKTSTATTSALSGAMASLGIAAAIAVTISAVTGVIKELGEESKATKLQLKGFEDGFAAVRKTAESGTSSTLQFFSSFGDALVSSNSLIGKTLEQISANTGKTVGEVVQSLTDGSDLLEKTVVSTEAKFKAILADTGKTKGDYFQGFFTGGATGGEDKLTREQVDKIQKLTGNEDFGTNFLGVKTGTVAQGNKELDKYIKNLEKTLQTQTRLATAEYINTSFDKYNTAIEKGADKTGLYRKAQIELTDIREKAKKGTIEEGKALAKTNEIIAKLNAGNIEATKSTKEFILANGLIGATQEEVAAAMKKSGVEIEGFEAAFVGASEAATTESSKISEAIAGISGSIGKLTRFDLPQDYLDDFSKVALGGGGQAELDALINSTQVQAGKLGVTSDELVGIASDYAVASLDVKGKFIEGSLNIADAFSFSAESFQDSQVSLDTILANSKQIVAKNKEWYDDIAYITEYGDGQYRSLITQLESQGIGVTFDAIDTLRKQLQAGNTKVAEALKEFFDNPTGVTPEQLKVLKDAGIVLVTEAGETIKQAKKEAYQILNDAILSKPGINEGTGKLTGGLAANALGIPLDPNVEGKANEIIDATVAPAKAAAASPRIKTEIEAASKFMSESVKQGFESGLSSKVNLAEILDSKFSFAFTFGSITQGLSGLNFGLNIGKSVVSGFIVGITPLYPKFRQILDTTYNVVNLSYVPQFQSLGKSVGNAFVVGVESSMSRLSSVVVSALNKAVDPLNKFGTSVNSVSSAVGSTFKIPKVGLLHSGGYVGEGAAKGDIGSMGANERAAVLLRKEFVVSPKGTSEFSRAELTRINKGDRSGLEALLAKRKPIGGGEGSTVTQPMIDKNFAKIVDFNFGNYFKEITAARDEMSGIKDLGDFIPSVGNKLFGMTDSFGKSVQQRVDNTGTGTALGAVNTKELGAVGGHTWRFLVAKMAAAGIPHRVSSAYLDRIGGKTYHAAGRAVDFVGPDMMKIFNFWLQFAGGLRELFYSPAAVYVKNGKVLRGLSGFIKATHYSHVHVAAANGANLDRATNLLAGEDGVESVIPWTKPLQAIKILNEAARRGWTRDVAERIKGPDNNSRQTSVDKPVIDLLTRIDERVANLEGRPVEINVASSAEDNGVMAEILGRKLERIL